MVKFGCFGRCILIWCFVVLFRRLIVFGVRKKIMLVSNCGRFMVCFFMVKVGMKR